MTKEQFMFRFKSNAGRELTDKEYANISRLFDKLEYSDELIGEFSAIYGEGNFTELLEFANEHLN